MERGLAEEAEGGGGASFPMDLRFVFPLWHPAKWLRVGAGYRPTLLLLWLRGGDEGGSTWALGVVLCESDEVNLQHTVCRQLGGKKVCEGGWGGEECVKGMQVRRNGDECWGGIQEHQLPQELWKSANKGREGSVTGKVRWH